MTVKELIAALKKMPPDLPVYRLDGDAVEGRCPVSKVEAEAPFASPHKPLVVLD